MNMLRAVAWLLLLSPCFMHAATSDHTKLAPKSPSPRPWVAIVNCVPFHLEILLGTIATVKWMNYDVVVYTYQSSNPQGIRVKDAMDYMTAKYGKFPVKSCADLTAEHKTHVTQHAKAVIYVSGQEEVKFNRKAYNNAISSIQPQSVVAIIHNTGRRSLSIPIVNSHSSVVMLALAKGNYKRMVQLVAPQPTNTRMGWFLPIVSIGGSIIPDLPARTIFTVQGNLDSSRRDYHSLFDDMTKHLPQLEAAKLQLQLVGAAKVPPPIPADISNIATLHLNLKFQAFYDQIQASIALVPALGQAAYINGTKITSTLVTSLMTAVPVLANDEFISAYSFLPANCFYRQLPGETIVQAMLRVATMTAEEHLLVRMNLVDARLALQHYNADFLRKQLDGVKQGPKAAAAKKL